MNKNTKTRITLDLSDDAYSLLENLAQGTTKADVLRRAIALFEIANDARRAGNRMAIVDAGGKVVTTIVGV